MEAGLIFLFFLLPFSYILTISKVIGIGTIRYLKTYGKSVIQNSFIFQSPFAECQPGIKNHYADSSLEQREWDRTFRSSLRREGTNPRAQGIEKQR